ncbi:M15 family metallopeptidase [Flavobacterium degerlachei]|jgi:D-alanyl-D-alanine dipeptidase|uniref:D-alanyl-D-alanine dipeptidase n=1 Tax=Flavobacterium degerlachei TaxID=229203 RepID=A0A1H2S7J6_9FLAO|nr:M15 family metallopeptidase [Flavobacterium degerlachei]SDW27516.1 D-alanyl-D-alanine dipeptidase [Flavobacterium degerlachei]
MNSSFRFCLFLGFLLLFVSCKAQVVYPSNGTNNKVVVNDTTFVNLKDYSSDFVYDMKYATEDNFLKAKVYDCAECYLRLKTVSALVEANKEFIKKGYRIKLFDCYRPLDIQKKMWKIVSNPKYVADPVKGSIHNRGGAVDITLVDTTGKELDMGTDFDFFGIEASHNYTKLSDTVKQNRILLKSAMEAANFNSFDSEWWHYNLKAGLNDKVSNVKWDCD